MMSSTRGRSVIQTSTTCSLSRDGPIDAPSFAPRRRTLRGASDEFSRANERI